MEFVYVWMCVRATFNDMQNFQFNKIMKLSSVGAGVAADGGNCSKRFKHVFQFPFC